MEIPVLIATELATVIAALQARGYTVVDHYGPRMGQYQLYFASGTAHIAVARDLGGWVLSRPDKSTLEPVGLARVFPSPESLLVPLTQWLDHRS
jgi:hypothetical protein